MAKVEVTATVELDEVLDGIDVSRVVDGMVAAYNMGEVAELLTKSDGFIRDVIDCLTPEELVAAILYGVAPEDRTAHGWLSEFREKLDAACGGPLGAKVEAPKADPDRTRLVNGLRWRFVGNHEYADARKAQKDGWRLPTRHEWQCDNAAVCDLDPFTQTYGGLLAWLGGEKQRDDDTILMWIPGDGVLEVGDATDKGATFLVREEK
jgi:hypothetical protein